MLRHGIADRLHAFAARRGLERERREECGHAEVIGLAPAVERMMMAFRTRDPHAEQYLRERAGSVARLVRDLVEVRGAHLFEGALRQQKLARELIERLVRCKALAN